MKTLASFLTVAVLFVAGCGKKDAAPSATATDSAPSSGNPLTAPVDYLGAVSKAQKTAVKVLDVSSVNKAIQEFNAGEGRYPKDLNELVKEHSEPLQQFVVLRVWVGQSKTYDWSRSRVLI